MFRFFSTFIVSIIFVTVLLVNNPDAKRLPHKVNLKSVERSPVILVPGDGGNQLEVKLNKKTKPHYFCAKKTKDYFNIWLNPFELFPKVIKCWVDNMRLIYDPISRKTRNPPGVELRVPGFGETSSLEWIDPHKYFLPFIKRMIYSDYYIDIIEDLVKAGFKRNINIRGAPYDWRKAPSVPVFCFYGRGLPTVERLDYSNPRSFPYKPNLIYGKGDGTVNARSLEACKRWERQQKQPVYHGSFEKLEHLKILHHQPIREFIVKFATTFPLLKNEKKCNCTS
ncbi:phospholipase A2 group XV [Nephila pilipes]|uniref:Phospholipase A2 group XV n=1 Tax=Nephila pilipes TaxID=299642 RepID=A0A8X6ISL0_NEPPI|nr:phospholipase A2 group XV [Nephila pilipes]